MPAYATDVRLLKIEDFSVHSLFSNVKPNAAVMTLVIWYAHTHTMVQAYSYGMSMLRVMIYLFDNGRASLD